MINSTNRKAVAHVRSEWTGVCYNTRLTHNAKVGSTRKEVLDISVWTIIIICRLHSEQLDIGVGYVGEGEGGGTSGKIRGVVVVPCHINSNRRAGGSECPISCNNCQIIALCLFKV